MIHIPCEKCGHDNKFLTVTEYAIKKGITRRMAKWRVEQGYIPHINIDGIVRVIPEKFSTANVAMKRPRGTI